MDNNKTISNNSIINSAASTNTTAASSNSQLVSNSFLYHPNTTNHNTNNIKNLGIGVYENITTSSEHYKSLPNFV
jgi:hypothetical protein